MDELLSTVEEAFGSLVAEYNVKVDETIESLDAFSDLGYVDHDIVDTGRLLNSKVLDVKSSADSWSADFTWDPQSPENGYKYANRVWAGYWSKGGKNFFPGRHWPERTAKAMGITKRFVELLQSEGLDATIVVDGDENIDD